MNTYWPIDLSWNYEIEYIYIYFLSIQELFTEILHITKSQIKSQQS